MGLFRWGTVFMFMNSCGGVTTGMGRGFAIAESGEVPASGVPAQHPPDGARAVRDES